MKAKTKRAPKVKKQNPLIIKDGEGGVLDVDAELFNIFIDTAQVTMAQMIESLEENRPKHAHMLSDDLKVDFIRLPDHQRGQAVSACNLWIDTHANGKANQLRDMIGLPHHTDQKIDWLTETVIWESLQAAEQADTVAKHDELVRAAVELLAQMKNPLAVARWKKHFQRLGLSADDLRKLLKKAEATVETDPIRILINQAATATEPDQAMRLLFESLANLSAFEIIKYKTDAQDKLGIAANLFDRLLAQSRKSKSRASVVEGQITYQSDPLGNFSILITHQLTLDDGANQPRVRYTVATKLADGRQLSTIEIDAEEFEEIRKWLPRHYGAEIICYVAPSQLYRVAMAAKEISRTAMRRETVHTYTGWTKVNGERAFLTASGAITKDGLDPSVRVDLGHNRLALYKLPAPTDDPALLRKAALTSLEFLHLAPRHVTVPLWCAMYGAPLMSAFSLNAVLWPYGPTQSGKSTLTMLALAHWGADFIKGRDYQAPKDWLSTITDLEGAMFVTKDLPLVIDDFAPQFTGMGDARDMHKRAHNVVRSVGNRSSRGRANTDLSERAQRPPRGLVIGTAELPLEGQSIVGRMIYISFERGDVFGPVAEGERNKLDEHQRMAGPGNGLYSVAMAGFVRWLAADWDNIIKGAMADHERANQYARTVFPSSQSRMMDYFANLLTYGRTAVRYLLSTKAISETEAQQLSEETIPTALVQILTNQSARVAGQSPVVRLFEALNDLVTSRRAHLHSRTAADAGNPHDSTLIGWHGYDPERRKQTIFLRLNVALQIAMDYWQKMGITLNTTPDALNREIYQSGLLVRRGEGQYAIPLRINDGVVRCLFIDCELLLSKYGFELIPPEEVENENA